MKKHSPFFYVEKKRNYFMNRQKLKSISMLLTTALIWGAAFVAQSVGNQYVGALTFNAMRFIIGGVVLIPCIAFFDRAAARRGQKAATAFPARRELWTGGVLCGLALCAGAAAQQFGILFTTVGKTGFITALYIVIVPLVNSFRGRRSGAALWLGVTLAVTGLYLLCMTESLSVGRGDLLVLLCAGVFAVHILLVDYYSPRVDCLRLSCIQFFVSGTVSAIFMFIFEAPQWPSICAAWKPVLYAGVFSSGIAYTLQTLGQKDLDPTVASLVLSLEAVFGVLAGWLLLGQVLSCRESWGCVLMFCAIMLAQLPPGSVEKAKISALRGKI